MHVRRTLPAMGTTAEVVVVAANRPTADDLVDAACRRIEALEALWSRFRPTSEITRMNLGDPTISADTLSWETRLLLDRAANAERITSGRFNPWLLADIRQAGYDRYYRDGGETDDGDTAGVIAGFDPGGIGKGLAADIVSDEIFQAGAAGMLVNLGGDLRVRGASPDGGPWTIAIDDPRTGGDLVTVTIAEGAVATSSVSKRRWSTSDGDAHHLIDPSTHRPATTTALSATVVAREAWQAEVLCKPLLLDWASPQDPIDVVESLGAAAIVVTPLLEVTSSRWQQFVQSSDQLKETVS